MPIIATQPTKIEMIEELLRSDLQNTTQKIMTAYDITNFNGEITPHEEELLSEAIETIAGVIETQLINHL